ncbi:MAG: hypothetical protein ABR502_00300 [Chitinophagaceae bacterium]
MNFKKTLIVDSLHSSWQDLLLVIPEKNQTDKQEKDSVNISETSKNTTDTGNFLVDSSGD